MKFKYQAKTKEGELQVGFVEAGTRDSAAAILSSHSLFILSLEDAEKIRWYDRLSSYFAAVKRKDMVIFTRQLAILLNAQLPLNDALRNLSQQTPSPILKEAVQRMNEDINSGLSFSQALERQGELFSGFFVSLVRAAEVTGNLAEATSFLADYYDKESVITNKVRSAMIYPIVVFLLFLVVATIMVTVVLPQIGPVFEQAGVQLPLFSRVLLGTGSFIGRWWFALIIVFVIMLGTVLDYLRTTEGEAVFDELKIRLPIVGRIYLPLIITRFSQNAAILLHGGVPVAQTIEIASQTVDNVVYAELLRGVGTNVREGQSLSQALAQYPDYFPALIPQMLVVGEATGKVEEIFTRLSSLYGRELDDTINNVTELIQPVLMVVLGILTGLLFASILIPLYKLLSTVR